MPEVSRYKPEAPRPMRGDPTMRPDVDIMGVQRGAHRDGPDICPKFQFKIPGGKNPDGSVLWGWNDAAAASCANCGRRDLEHVVIRDYTAEAIGTTPGNVWR